jgi:RNA polymerase sigma factor (sigma-70 family)
MEGAGDVIERCIRGDRRAQTEFHKEHFAFMMSFAFNYTNQRDTALDWVSQAYVRVFLNLKKFDQKRDLKPWMQVILKNIIIDDLRKRAKEIALWAEEAIDSAQQASDSSVPIQYTELSELVDRELDHLGKDVKQIFMLHVIEGYSHKEIALKMGLATGTSRWYVSEAKRKLRNLLTQNDYGNE